MSYSRNSSSMLTFILNNTAWSLFSFIVEWNYKKGQPTLWTFPDNVFGKCQRFIKFEENAFFVYNVHVIYVIQILILYCYWYYGTIYFLLLHILFYLNGDGRYPVGRIWSIISRGLSFALPICERWPLLLVCTVLTINRWNDVTFLFYYKNTRVNIY